MQCAIAFDRSGGLQRERHSTCTLFSKHSLFISSSEVLSPTFVRPSVCLSHRSTAAVARGGFAAERPADRTYRSIAADAGVQQQRRRSTALSSKCRQCRVDSRVDEAEHGLVYGCYAMRSKWQVDFVRRHRDGWRNPSTRMLGTLRLTSTSVAECGVRGRVDLRTLNWT